MGLLLTVMVQSSSIQCNECHGDLTEEEIALVLWGGKRGVSRISDKIIVNAHYCKECENWILDNDLYEQLKSDYPRLRISTTNLMKYVDQSKEHVVPYNPVIDKYGAFKDGMKMKKCSVSI